MHTFEQATYFVRDILAHASDEQLLLCRLTAEQRDKLLEKDVQFKPMTKNYQAAFYPHQSYKKDVSYISYNKHMGQKHILDTAAHEQYHAAYFWGRSSVKEVPPPNQIIDKFVAPVAIAGAGCIVTGFLIDGPFLEMAGLAVGIGFPLTRLVVNQNYRRQVSKDDERDAYRFGCLFNQKAYKQNKKTHTKPVEIITGVNTNVPVSVKYPSRKEIKEIYKQTRQECIGGNILFPEGSPKAVFQEWRRQNGYIIS